jgi:hypothetical protein
MWKSLRDPTFPTLLRETDFTTENLNELLIGRKGLVTDVSGPQRNACAGTLTPLRACLPIRARQRTFVLKLMGWANALRKLEVERTAYRLEDGFPRLRHSAHSVSTFPVDQLCCHKDSHGIFARHRVSSLDARSDDKSSRRILGTRVPRGDVVVYSIHSYTVNEPRPRHAPRESRLALHSHAPPR